MNSRWIKGGVISVTLAVVGLGVAWWLNTVETDATWERIRTRGVISIATDASFPPFAAVDDTGNLFGFDIDLAEALGRRLGVQVEFENIAYDALLGVVLSERNDAVISAYVIQPERMAEVAFTRAYFVNGTVAVVRADRQNNFTGEPLDWARQKTIAVEYGANGDALARRWARRVAGVTIVPRSTAVEALLAVEASSAEVALADAITAYEFLADHPALRLTGPPIEPEPYAIMVNIRSRELWRALEQALQAMEQEGELALLKTKWKLSAP